MDFLPAWYLPLIATLFGLVVGSFLNVVVYRVPAGISLMGSSKCPKCDHAIRPYDNVPVLAWLLWLRGKCRDCKAPISWRYPAVEALTGLSWLGVSLWMGWSPLLPLLLFFASVSIALSLIDFDTLRLPNTIVWPTNIIVAVYLAVLGFTTNNTDALLRAAECAAAFGVFYFLFWYLSAGRALGFGDVKLSLALGALTGWFSIGSAVVGTAAAFLIGGVPAAILLLTGVLKRGTKIPFGPSLIAGAWVGMIWGEYLANLYLTKTGLIH